MAAFVKTVAVCGLLAAVAVSCGNGTPKPYSHEGVRMAAADCYSALVGGDYRRYLSYFAGQGDSLPEEYYSQLADMSAQFLSQWESSKSLVGVRAVSDSLFADSTADVFLEVAFADSTVEMICLPMILKGGKWMVR